jgi:hypothetical protein
MVDFTRSSTKEDALQHADQEILGYVAFHAVHTALQTFDIKDIDIFLFYDESELLLPFCRTATHEDPVPQDIRVSITHAGIRLYLTKLWYLDQPYTEFSIWYNLSLLSCKSGNKLMLVPLAFHCSLSFNSCLYWTYDNPIHFLKVTFSN